MISFGWVLWCINHCRLFNTKSFLYIYIKYVWLRSVGFYGISTARARSIFKRSLTGLNSEFSFSSTSCLTKAEEPSLSYYLPIKYHSWEDNWIHTFPKGISAMWNAISLGQDLNSCPYPTTITITPRAPPKTIVGYLMPNHLYTHVLNIYDLFGWVSWHISDYMLFNAKSFLYIYYIYIFLNIFCRQYF